MLRRPHLGSWAVFCFALASCGSGPTDPNLGPDGQVIPTTCVDENTASLEVGQAVEYVGAYARFFCLEGHGDAPLDFVLTLVAAGTTGLDLEVESNNSIAPRTSPSPGPSETPPAEAPTPDDAFHLALREWEIAELGRLITGPGLPGARSPAAPAAIPSVGETLVLNAQANVGGTPSGACELPLNVTARVEAVSTRAIVVADIGNPSGGFTSTDYQRYAAQFDTLLAPLAETHFGPATDIDANGRTILFFTKEVNRLTPRNANSFTAGFFFARDLFPRQRSADGRFSGCTHSNEAEILYLLVPDPLGTINGNDRSRAEVDQLTLGTVIHEYQHLINAGRRLYVNRLSASLWAEEPWLNEGLSHIAEELLFYRASGLAPRSNIGQVQLVLAGFRALSALDRHLKHNFLRFFDFLERPESHGPYDASVSLETRGAAWHFLRYLADRSSGDAAFFFDLVDSNTRGLANLAEVVGGMESLFEHLSHWRVATYADSRVANLAESDRDLSWDLPSIHGRVSSGSYPIRSVTLSSGLAVTRDLDPGGAAHFRFGVATDALASVDVRVNGLLPPAPLRAIVLRTR
jgi:hypothetical protein